MKYILGLVMVVVGGVSIASADCRTNPLDCITQNDQKVVDTAGITDPLRNGANNPGSRVRGLYYQGPITTYLQAENQTLAFIQKMINYFLSIVGLIALIYLIYHGFQMVTAAGDDAKFKSGAKALRSATIALIGIAVSAFVVNLILYLIAKIL